MRYYYRMRDQYSGQYEGLLPTPRTIREAYEVFPATSELDEKWKFVMSHFNTPEAEQVDFALPVYDACKVECGNEKACDCFANCESVESAYAYLLVSEITRFLYGSNIIPSQY